MQHHPQSRGYYISEGAPQYGVITYYYYILTSLTWSHYNKWFQLQSTYIMMSLLYFPMLIFIYALHRSTCLILVKLCTHLVMYNWLPPSLYTTSVVYFGCPITHYYFKWMTLNMWNVCHHTQSRISLHTHFIGQRTSTKPNMC